ncbi:hypothetical protein ACSBR1_001122 [Camellia fascicularis]
MAYCGIFDPIPSSTHGNPDEHISQFMQCKPLSEQQVRVSCEKAKEIPMEESNVQLAEAAKAQFSRDYNDHLALVWAYEGWKEAERDVAGYEYWWKNFLSAQSMKGIDALRREFYSSLKDTSLVDSNNATCKHLI